MSTYLLTSSNARCLPSFHNTTLISAASPPSSDVCDAIPAARLVSDPQPAHSPAIDASDLPINLGAALVLNDAENITSSSKVKLDSGSPPPSEQLSLRKLCVRHQGMETKGQISNYNRCVFLSTSKLLCMLNTRSNSP